MIIAHRSSTIRSADHIMVLDNGTIAQTGTHDQLAAHRDGPYAEMIATRFDS
ncbi:hypothetical protein [Nocardia sp. BMG111209]|uniref:hypothetical protein n=1 Tax=Nocardia sp. BMG111209 TaxID=1160137 RepID=UPI00036DF3D9|nr:hypothetical protein [Nocardia sp. BMG111209]